MPPTVTVTSRVAARSASICGPWKYCPPWTTVDRRRAAAGHVGQAQAALLRQPVGVVFRGPLAKQWRRRVAGPHARRRGKGAAERHIFRGPGREAMRVVDEIAEPGAHQQHDDQDQEPDDPEEHAHVCPSVKPIHSRPPAKLSRHRRAQLPARPRVARRRRRPGRAAACRRRRPITPWHSAGPKRRRTSAAGRRPFPGSAASVPPWRSRPSPVP